MVDGIGAGGGATGRAAIEAALKRLQSRARELSGETSPSQAGGSPFADALQRTVQSVDDQVRRADGATVKALEGELDFHEVTAQLKESELSFEFAMQVRNKLIEAYREVMRMNV